MARKLLVEIVGDTSSLERAFASAGGATTRLGGTFGTLARTAGVLAGGAALGGITLLLDKSVKAALAGQASQAKLDQALRATHQSVQAMTPALDAAQEASRKFGFSDEDTRESLAKLEIATGNTKNAISDLSVAQDIARFKHVDLTAASQTLAQAMTGSQRAVKQLGITVAPVTTNMNALRLSGEKLTTAEGMADEAHAKLADKMLTSKAIIQAVTDKVHGQADAFAGTAAGGMEQFHAQLTHLEEGLGNTLLPALTTTLDWVNSHWPQISAVFQAVFSAVGDAITAAKPYFDAFVGWVGSAIAFVQQHWGQVSAVVTQVMNLVKSVIDSIVTVVKAIWQEFGNTILDVVKRSLNAVISIFQNVYNIIVGVVNLISDVIHGHWSDVWGDVKKIVGNAIGALATIISTAVSNIVDEAIALGKAIIGGILKGLGALGRMVLHALGSLANSVISAGADAIVAAVSIGGSIVQGVINGIGSLAKSLLQKVKDVIMAPINAVKSFLGIGSPSRLMHEQIGAPMAQGLIEGWIAGSATLPDTMTQTMQKAVEAARSVVSGAKASFETAFGGLSSAADQMFSGISGAQTTPAGRALAGLQAAHDAAALNDQIGSARVALTTAQQDGDPATIVAAQQALNDLLYQRTVAFLQKRAAAEQKNLDATNQVRQIAFDKALTQLQDHLAKGHTSTKEAMKDIETLLRTYGITFGNVGRDMGVAWVQGLKDSITAAAAKGGKLAGVLKQQAADIQVPKAATGGYVAGTGLAIIHQGEHVVPAGGSMGGRGNTYKITVQSLDPRTAGQVVVEAINSYERQNGRRFVHA